MLETDNIRANYVKMPPQRARLTASCGKNDLVNYLRLEIQSRISLFIN